jgi:hypothetical protein
MEAGGSASWRAAVYPGVAYTCCPPKIVIIRFGGYAHPRPVWRRPACPCG